MGRREATSSYISGISVSIKLTILQDNIRKQLEDLRGTANGEALRLYIDEQIKKISDIKFLTPENVESRKKACEILDVLFSFLGEKKIENIKTKYN